MNQQDSAPTDRCNILFFDPVRSSSEPRELQYPGGLKEDASSPQMPREDVCDGIREPQRAPESEFIRNSFAIRERKALAPTVETGGTQKGRMRKVQCACRECRQDKRRYSRYDPKSGYGCERCTRKGTQCIRDRLRPPSNHRAVEVANASQRPSPVSQNRRWSPSTSRLKLEPTDLTESHDSRHHMEGVTNIKSPQNSADDVGVARRFDYVRKLLAEMEAESQKRSSVAEEEVRNAEAHVRAQESMLQELILKVASASKVLQEAINKYVLTRNRRMALCADQTLIKVVVQRTAAQLRLGAVQPSDRGVIEGRRGWPSVE